MSSTRCGPSFASAGEIRRRATASARSSRACSKPPASRSLYVRRKAPFTPLIHGGHQERERRGGTESVPLIAGLGAAAALARKKLATYDANVRPLRDALETGLLATIPGAELNGHREQRLANTTNLHFPGLESEALLLLLDQAGLCASSGSACLADSPDPSHVIAAMKPGPAARQSIRFSLGAENQREEINEAITTVRRCVATLGGVQANEVKPPEFA